MKNEKRKEATYGREKNAPGSLWIEYLTGKGSASAFLANIRKNGVPLPSDAEVSRFGMLVADSRSCLDRLVQLLRATSNSDVSIRSVVSDLTGESLKGVGVSVAVATDSDAFCEAAEDWLDSLPKRPVDAHSLKVLFITIWLGSMRNLLDEEGIVYLLQSAMVKPREDESDNSSWRPDSPVDALLQAEPKPEVFGALSSYADCRLAENRRLLSRIHQKEKQIGEMDTKCEELSLRLASQHEEAERLRAVLAEAQDQVSELKKELSDTHDAYKTQLHDLRGKYRGALQGELTRWLETALDASRADPPWIPAIQERLEDALELVRRGV